MHSAVLRPLKIVAAWLTATVLMLFLCAPLLVYQHTLGLVDPLPTKPTALLSQRQVDQMWAARESCSQEVCASITPYWIYGWLTVAIVNDFIYRLDTMAPYDNVSRMASQIAIQHMRSGKFKGRGMLWWHLTHVCLGIWLQRNWTPSEIATEFLANHA